MGVPFLRHSRPGLRRALCGVRQVVLQLLRQCVRQPHHPAPGALEEQSGVCSAYGLVSVALICSTWICSDCGRQWTHALFVLTERSEQTKRLAGC